MNGFHLHEKNMLTPSTNSKGEIIVGGMAGGHWDPDKTGKHLGPEGNGHRGDLPQIEVNAKGMVNQKIMSKKIKLSDITGKSFMVHINPDNYTDKPSLGGSGARMYGAAF
ncbi:MAG: superoxide dismutase family protein, partial [Brevinema sp.]